MTGFYSVAEVVDDSNKRPEKTIFCMLDEDEGELFTAHQLKSFKMIEKMVKANGGTVCESLQEVADFLNK